MTLEPVLLPDAKGRTALVLGAGGGIGRATTALLSRAGVAVVAGDLEVISIPEDAVESLVCDAADEDSVAALVAAAARLGPIDYLINCAGVTGGGPITEMAADDWRRVMDINLTSCFFLAKHAKAQLRSPGGAVVLMSSTNAINGGGPVSGAAYAVAKAGILNLTRYLAKEWAGDGIRVNCLAPGPVDTPMLSRIDAAGHEALKAAVPMGRYATADEIAANILFLCSEHAGFQTGTVTNISGGLMLD